MRFAMRMVSILTLGAVLLPVSAVAATSGDDGIDAWDLYYGDATVTLNQPVRMFECWVDMPSGRAHLYQKVAGRWKLLDIADESRDVAKCGADKPIKAVYEFTIKSPGTWNSRKGYYEASVLTKCVGCVTYKWTIPVVR